MRLLLDTHVFLWTIAANARIGETAHQKIADPANEIFVSSASAWEIAIKHALGRLPLPASPPSYVPSRMNALGFSDLSITQRHVLAVDGLPPLHRDPFDRIIVAQAQLERLTLVSADELVLRYPVKLLDARS